MRPSLRRTRRQMLAPLYWQYPTSNAHQWPETPNRVESSTLTTKHPPRLASVINYSSINNASHIAYPVETEKREGVEIKKRPQPPCPCPDDIRPHRLAVPIRRDDGKRHIMFGTDEDVDIKDQLEFCRRIKSKLREESNRTTGLLQQNLRARLLAEKTWFELQCKLFLPPPITNRSMFVNVLQKFENIRNTLSTKERRIWKKVGQFYLPHCRVELLSVVC